MSSGHIYTVLCALHIAISSKTGWSQQDSGKWSREEEIAGVLMLSNNLDCAMSLKHSSTILSLIFCSIIIIQISNNK